MLEASDSGMLSPGWAHAEVEIVSDQSWIAAALRVEVALAKCQADLGLIPRDAAEIIEVVAGSLQIDPRLLARGVYEASNPAVELVRILQQEVDRVVPSTSNYVHVGATSQDILDSASMLVCTQALHKLQTNLGAARGHLVELMRTTSAIPMVGRTVSQHAVPMTFGVKAATWLNLLIDVELEVRGHLDSGLPLSLAGAAGTLAAYGEYGTQATGQRFDPFSLVDAVADALALNPHYQPWHTARTPIARIASTLAMVSGVMGKIAVDIQLMSRTEIGEVCEGQGENGGISSSMPQKRNPVKSTLILASAKQVPAYALVLLQGMVAEDERPSGSWQSEWQPLRDTLRMTLGTTALLAELIRDLQVDEARMLTNLRSTGVAVVSERLNVALTPLVGKVQARDILRRLLLAGITEPTELLPKLRRELVDLGVVDQVNLEQLLVPEDYVGSSAEIVRRALVRSEQIQAQELLTDESGRSTAESG